VEILFLGSGSGKRVPVNYHHDRVCLEARKPGAKESRTQSSIIISESNAFLLFDVTEDFLEQAKREKLDPNELTAVFATDGHEESIGGLGFLDGRLNKKIKFYSSVKVIERVKERFKNLKNIEPEIIEDEKIFKINKISVTPFETQYSVQKGHSTFSYQIKTKGIKVAYSKNSGNISENKEHYYKENDCLIINENAQKTEWLAGLGNKITIITGIGHGTLLHQEMEENIKNEYKKFRTKEVIQVGNDGLRLALGSEQRSDTREVLIEAKKALDEDSGEALIPERIAEQKIRWATYEIPPFGKLIWEGKKTLIAKNVSLARHIKESLLLCSGEYIYGIVTLEKGIEVDLEKFKELESKHFVSDGLRKKMWHDNDKLYIYEFQFEKFDKIRKFKKVKGFQNFINATKIKFVGKDLGMEDWIAGFALLPDEFLKGYIEKLTPEALSGLSRMDLICFHARGHYLWGKKDEKIFNEESLVNTHYLTVQEFERREPLLKHEVHNDLDRASEAFGKKMVDKNTSEINIYGKTLTRIFTEEGTWSLEELEEK